jgi:putative sterol carrier protein
MTETDNAPEAALDADAGAPLGDADANQMAALVAGATDEQLMEGMADIENRKRVLDEIFRRMAEHVNADAAKNVDAVVHFRITEHPEGGEDVYEVVIESGKLEVTNEPGREPRVAFVIGPVEFLRLVTGNAAGPMLFMSGKLKIEGDMMFAAQLTSLFTIPGAPQPAA